MNFGPTTYGLGLLAGALSTLSPCVLPLVPVLLAAAVSAHRWGALALGAGLALSFTLVGLFLATLGASLGLDPDTFRTIGAIILVAFGLILLVPKLQDLFARAISAASNSGNQLLSRMTIGGFAGQFIVGALLGVVWSPCVGPTLGAATTLASQGKDLGQIALLMVCFWPRRGLAPRVAGVPVAREHDEDSWTPVGGGQVRQAATWVRPSSLRGSDRNGCR